jgi:hypothetical protein
LVVGLVALVAWAWWYSVTHPVKRVTDLGAVEVAEPDAPRWWASAAHCLRDRAPYPVGVRFYVGRTIPHDWGAEDGAAYGGYTNPYTRQILLAPGFRADSALIAHELWHIVHGAGHPTAVFGADGRGRCGLAGVTR